MAVYTAKISALKKEIQPAKLMIVTKHQPFSRVQQLIESGATVIGENRVQEVVQKYTPELLQSLRQKNGQLHFIGHLQTNKVKTLLPYIASIDSVDTLRLAKKINDESRLTGRKTDVFLQVNLTKEPQKFGWLENELRQSWSELQELKGLNIRGLMCMGEEGHKEATRQAFRNCQNLRNELGLCECSMGMSADYRVALEEGSTLVRIGSLIF